MFNLLLICIMEIKKFSFLITVVDDEIVIGEIIRWEKHSMDIILIYPYSGWESHYSIMSFAELRHYKDLRSQKGVDRGKFSLAQCYKKAKRIYTDLERLSKVYRDHKLQIQEVEKINNTVIRQQILKKLEDYFFDYSVFKKLSTDLFSTSKDRKRTYEILDDYLKEEM